MRDLLLIGGGHSHVLVLRQMGMVPPPGVRITLLSREVETPYSGMLPGHVAGRYQREEMHIDLRRLCRQTGANLLADAAVGLDPESRLVHCAKRPPIRYDLLSINCGATPERHLQSAVAVKPIGNFLSQWRRLRGQVSTGDRLLIVGGGAGGVELALAARQALPTGTRIDLIAENWLPGLAAGARRRLLRELAEADIGRIHGRVTGGDEKALCLADGQRLAFEHLLSVTGVAAPEWIRGSGLATDAAGFIQVNAFLASVSHRNIFAAGDIIRFADRALPKSGLYAVRAGPILATNLRRALTGKQRLRRFRPQKRGLALMATGDGRAVVSWGRFSASGRWAWRWKNWLDQRFMRRFEPRRMTATEDQDENGLESSMRCGGCGAKLGADILRRALARLPTQPSSGVVQGIGDDAAILSPQAAPLVLTTDGFRSLLDDPWRFGRITAHHCLNDIHAMGARPVSALALATVPFMAPALMEEELYQMLAGAASVLNAEAAPLVGGHSAEGAERFLGLTLTGAQIDPPLHKAGGRPGDRLILTKPLGTGLVFAAEMRNLLPAHQVQAAIDSMDQSNRSALAVLRRHQVRAATDVTGFGLIGHLQEMLTEDCLGVDLWLDRLPVLPGALEALNLGVSSVLQAENEGPLRQFELSGCNALTNRVRLLADPQTAGGLLASVPADQAQACVVALRAAGYATSAEVGVVTAAEHRIIAAVSQ